MAAVAGWAGVGRQVGALAGVVGALSQLGGPGVVGAGAVAEVGAWGSLAAAGAVVGVGAVVGSRGVGAAAGSEPAQRGLLQPPPLGSPPWVWGSRRW